MSKTTTINNRIEVLKAMHLIMQSMNNEEAYWYWATYAVPDEPSEDDFESIAENKDEFDDCVNTFRRAMNLYGKDGIFCGLD